MGYKTNMLLTVLRYVWETLSDGWGLTFGDRQAAIARICAERAKSDYKI
jgi:hypothetical protein